MKKLAVLLLSSVLTLSVGAETFKAPDILIDSKLNYDWSQVLIGKFRKLLKNYKMDDPFTGVISGPVIVNEASVGQYLSDETKEFMNDFGNAVGLNVVKGETKVVMHNFSYDVRDFKTNLKASEQAADGLVVGTDFSASEVTLTADKISLSLVIPGRNSSPIFQVDVINPIVKASEERMVNFFAKIKIQDNKDFYKLQILKANFDQMAKGLLENPNDIQLDYQSISIPDVSIKIGNKKVAFSPEKIQNLIRSNHNAIKGLLLAQVASMLTSNTTQAAFKVLEQFKINKEYWLKAASLQSQIQIGKFSGTDAGNNIQIDLPGDFCTSQKFDQLKQDCVNNKTTQTATTRLTKNLHNDSVVEMKDLLDRGDANFVASISEDYLNKLLVATIDAGLWKTALDEANVQLGPNKASLRLDKRGDSGTFVMDVVYKPSTLERFMTGSKEIRFPLVLDVAVRVEKFENEPVIIVRLNDVDASDATLINGRIKENIVSTVKDVPRFQSKIAKAIREKISVFKGKDMIELRYPELRGLGLDKVHFLSDGNGRMNATMRLEDLMEDSIR